MLATARKYANNTQWTECIHVANAILESEPNNNEALSLKAVADEALSRKAVAEKKVRRIDGLLATAREYANNAQWNECIYAANKVLELDATNHEATKPKENAQKKCERESGTERILTLPNGLTIEMIYCKPGAFVMGSPESEKGCRSNETQHLVKLTKGFWLGKYPITQEQWQGVLGENPSHFRGNRNPVENISWNDCQGFIKKINAMLNCGARLPTEAEWEYACRAGTTGAYGGTGVLDDMGWFDNTVSGTGLSTHPVGQKMANDWGFHDMHGNVWEWCEDWYGDYEENAIDPCGPASGSRCVLRGGCWSARARNCRSASRGRFIPELRANSCGFRLCCSTMPPQ